MTTTIALSKLTANKDNVRRTQSEAGLTELCASIEAHGLLKTEDQHTLAARERTARQREQETEALANGETFTPEPEQMPESGTSPSDHDTADGYSMAFIFDLTALRTAALAHAVIQRPDVGLALAVHALALRVFYQGT